MLAFRGCTSLESVQIPSSVRVLSGWTFQQCESLKKIDLPNGLVSIDCGAFIGCRSLDHIRIPNTAEMIRENAFEDCTGLAIIHVPNSVRVMKNSIFKNCTGLKTAYLPSSLEHIGMSCFEGCSSLSSIHLDMPGHEAMEKLFSIVTKTDEKLLFAVGMLEEGVRSALLESYLKQYIKQAMLSLCRGEYDAMLLKLLGMSYLQDDISRCFDEVFREVNSSGSVKMKALLLNYRQNALGYKEDTDAFEL